MRPQAADRRPYGVFLITALLTGGLFIRFALGSRKAPSDCRNEDGGSHARKPVAKVPHALPIERQTATGCCAEAAARI